VKTARFAVDSDRINGKMCARFDDRGNFAIKGVVAGCWELIFSVLCAWFVK